MNIVTVAAKQVGFYDYPWVAFLHINIHSDPSLELPHRGIIIKVRNALLRHIICCYGEIREIIIIMAKTLWYLLLWVQ